MCREAHHGSILDSLEKKNDVDAMYAAARSRKTALVRVVAGQEELRTGTIQERFPRGVVLIQRVPEPAG